MKSYILSTDVESIAEFFVDQPGGKLCLSIVYDICQVLVSEKESEATALAVGILYEMCGVPIKWNCRDEGWMELFLLMIKELVNSMEDYVE